VNKELRELLSQLEKLKVEARSFLNENKLQEAEAKTEEVRNLQKRINVLKDLGDDNEQRGTKINNDNQTDPETEYRSVFDKALRRKMLTNEENEVLAKRSLTEGVPADGGLIVPKDVQTKINEYKRLYKSMKSLIGFYPTTTQTGVMPYEDLSTMTELTNLLETKDILETQPKFKSTGYTVADYAGIIPISNTLLQDEKGNLMEYIGKWFSKKATRTENKKIFEVLKNGKTATALTDWKALKSSLNKDLDPLLSAEAIIVTNQDGFDFLDSALDGTGRPLLQPDPTNPTQYKFAGRMIHVFSNAELPTVTTTGTTPQKKVPFFYGALEEAVKFVDREVYQIDASKEAGFTKNMTLVRCIERFDVLKTDNDAYVYGEVTLA